MVADVFSSQMRSEVMSRIKSCNTKPEIQLRSILHRLGYRFTIHGPKNKKLPGRPDIVLPKYKTVIFVHGCFWHGHDNCRDFKMPKTRQDYWVSKIAGNRARDLRNTQALEAMGWKVLSIWACSFEALESRQKLITKLPGLIGSLKAVKR
jgi:DNA mismatch endonuclease (patch repair protein)